MFYPVFRAFIALCLRIFYRRIEVLGLERVPPSGAVLLLANHGNALLDPLLLLARVPRRISFLAKHTLFPMPVIGFFLRGIGGLPVYRKQDAPGEGHRNEETFRACENILAAGGAVCLFPEGKSHDEPQLQPVRRGAARIFLRARERIGSPTAVIPVGIHFESKRTFRSRVLVVFGRPVDVGGAPEGAASDPEAQVDSLTRRFAEALKTLMPNVDSWGELEFVREIQFLFTGKREESLAAQARPVKRFLDAYRFYRDRESASVLRIREKWEVYRRQLARLGMTDREVDLAQAPGRAAGRALAAAFVVLVGFPLAALGVVVHFLPYQGCKWLERRINRFPDQAATVKLLAGLALVPPTYVLILALPAAQGRWRWVLFGLVVLPVSGWAALLVGENRQMLHEGVRALGLAVARGRSLDAMRRQRDDLLMEVARLVSRRPPPGPTGAVAEEPGSLR